MKDQLLKEIIIENAQLKKSARNFNEGPTIKRNYTGMKRIKETARGFNVLAKWKRGLGHFRAKSASLYPPEKGAKT
jgi:hypothetical protein